MRVAMIGGGAAGLLGALLLARAGWDVVVLDRDDLTPAADVEAAARAAFHAAAPQIVQPHVILALCRELLQERLPDVYADLLAAGVVEAPLAAHMPPTLADRSPQPGDERMPLLMTRRSTVDWVLGRAAAAEPGVRVRGGVRVTGLLARPGDPPDVVGVRTSVGDMPAEVIVDAAGRRSGLDGWLVEIGARPSGVARAECGAAYYSRHYRVRTGAELPGPPTTRVVAGLDEFTVGIWSADAGTMLLALCPLVADTRFRSVRDPAVFTAVLRSVPFYAAWLDVLDPISAIFPMGGLHNTLRRLVVDGEPVATGLHAVGDSVCTTNPTLGRGLSLALRGVTDLADTIVAHPDDPYAQSLAMDALVDVHVAPFYADQARIDSARLAALRHVIFGEPAPVRSASGAGRVSYAELRSAAPFDPMAFRAFWTIMGMLRPPDEVYSDPALVARVREVIATHSLAPPMRQPSRPELLAALSTPATVG